MHIDILKLVSVKVYIFYVFQTYMLATMYFLAVVRTTVKTVLTSSCLNIQLPGVFWANVNYLETSKYFNIQFC